MYVHARLCLLKASSTRLPKIKSAALEGLFHSAARNHKPDASAAPRSSAQMEYVPAKSRCVPQTAPVGKRRPGGSAGPVMCAERSASAKSHPAPGSGANTSSSRLTSVNW